MIRFFFLGRALAQGQMDEPPAAKKKKLNDRGPMRQLSITQFFALKNENADSRDTFLCDYNNCSYSAREFDQLLMHKIKTHKKAWGSGNRTEQKFTKKHGVRDSERTKMHKKGNGSRESEQN